MRIPLIALYILSIFPIFVLPAVAGQETDIKESIVGVNPKFNANIVTNPLNQTIRRQFRPGKGSGSAESVPYEEAIPYGGTYYPSEGGYYSSEGGGYYSEEGRYYENPPLEESPPSEQKYYEGGGQYYLPSSEEE